MTWLYIPKQSTTSTYAQAPECLDLALNALLKTDYKPYVTLSGKAMQRPISWRGWKTRPWIRRLSGMTLKPCVIRSLLTSFKDSVLCSSPQDTHANHSALPETVLAKLMNDIYGRGLLNSLSRLNPNAVFSRTCQDTFPWGSTPSTQIYKDWATELRQDSLRRRKLARATGANGCSSWGTPRASHAHYENPEALDARGISYPLGTQAAMWRIPSNSDPVGGIAEYKAIKNGIYKLRDQAPAWPTPVSRDHKGPNGTNHLENGTGRKHLDQLPNFVSHCLPHSQPSLTDGVNSSKTIRELNPRFVELLMGWPRGWTTTDCVLPETELYRWRLLMRLSLYGLLWKSVKG